METSLEEFKNEVLIEKNSRKYLSCGKKIVKIGPVDADIYSVDLKKEEITEGKIARSAIFRQDYWTDLHQNFTRYSGINSK